MTSRRRGFTLVQMLAAILVIGVLAGIAAGNFGTSASVARGGGVKSDAATLSSYVDAYSTMRGQNYPSTYSALATSNAMANVSPTSLWALRSVTSDAKGALVVVTDLKDTTRRCTAGVGSLAQTNPMTCTF